MARLPRLEIPHLAHLVSQPVLAGEQLVQDDADLLGLKLALGQAARDAGVKVHGWRIQRRELCLLVTPDQAGSLSAFMQGVGRLHVARYNRRHGREGGLWGGRFRSCALQPGTTVLDALHFVEAPAWAAQTGSATSPGGWQPAEAGAPVLDSSLPTHLGQGTDALCREHASFWGLGNTPFEREAAWKKRLDQGLPSSVSDVLARSLRSGNPVGDAAFLAGLGASLPSGRPVTGRPRGRPRKVLVCP